MTAEGVRNMIWAIVGLIVGFGGGWYCKGRFGAKAAAVKSAVETVV